MQRQMSILPNWSRLATESSSNSKSSNFSASFWRKRRAFSSAFQSSLSALLELEPEEVEFCRINSFALFMKLRGTRYWTVFSSMTLKISCKRWRFFNMVR